MGENIDLSDMAAELGQIDLNEWVGECGKCYVPDCV